MKNPTIRAVGAALAALATFALSTGASAAPANAPVASLTLKEIIARQAQVDFDLQGLEGQIGELRKDVQAGLGRGAAIRVFDIGVGLVRDRVMLNAMPQTIGAMQREGRTESWQRGRQEERMKEQQSLLKKHGSLYRVVEGYAADVEEKFGIKLRDFFKAMESAVARGDTNVDAVLQQYRDAVISGDNSRTEQLTDALKTGSDVPPPAPPTRPTTKPTGDSSTIVSTVPHPTRPGYYIVRYADGHEEIVPGQDNGDGTVTLTLPNGQSVTTSVTGGSAGGGGGMNGAGGGGAMDGAGGGSGIGGGGMAGGGGAAGPLPAGVTRTTLPSGEPGYAVTDENGNVRYFPADLTKGGIGTRYLGEKGTRLIEEVQEFLDLSPAAAGGQYKIRQGNSIRWQFAIMPVGQSPDPSGGTKATFKLSDRSGQGTYTVTGWRIMQPDGSQLAAGTGEEASAVVTQSGNYRVEYSGTTSWGSAFRIEANVPIAVQ